MTECGYVKLWRCILKSDIWLDESPSVLKVFIWLLAEASWKRKRTANGLVETGSLLTTERKCAKGCKLSRKSVQWAWDRLAKIEMITLFRDQYGDQPGTRISILNYAKFQERIDMVGDQTRDQRLDGESRKKLRSDVNVPPNPPQVGDLDSRPSRANGTNPRAVTMREKRQAEKARAAREAAARQAAMAAELVADLGEPGDFSKHLEETGLKKRLVPA